MQQQSVTMGHGDGLDLSHPPASVTYDILRLTTAITGNAIGLIDIKARELCESRGAVSYTHLRAHETA